MSESLFASERCNHATPTATCPVCNEPRVSGEKIDSTKDRIYALASEAARLVCVEDVPYVDDPENTRKLDLVCNELGHLLGLPEPEFKDIWKQARG